MTHYEVRIVRIDAEERAKLFRRLVDITVLYEQKFASLDVKAVIAAANELGPIRSKFEEG